MGATLSTRNLHTNFNLITFNLSLADLLISSLVDSFTVVGKLNSLSIKILKEFLIFKRIGILAGENFFKTRPGLCSFVAAICLIACECSLMNIGLLAVNR